MLQEVITFLRDAKVFFLATQDGTQPRVRPFGLVMDYKGMPTFCTATGKQVYQQLQANPKCEICTFHPSGEWLRLEGNALFLDDREAKELFFALSPSLLRLYPQGVDSPNLTVFGLKDAKATLADLTGNSRQIDLD